jgi:hypothetical protein
MCVVRLACVVLLFSSASVLGQEKRFQPGRLEPGGTRLPETMSSMDQRGPWICYQRSPTPSKPPGSSFKAVLPRTGIARRATFL